MSSNSNRIHAYKYTQNTRLTSEWQRLKNHILPTKLVDVIESLTKRMYNIKSEK